MPNLSQHPITEPAPGVEVLPPPAGSLAELTATLRTGSAAERAEAARQLRDFAPECLEPLCAALKDPEEAVRSAAAESLGVIGDERAVRPLVEALRAPFPGKSPRRQRIGGLLLAITVPLALVATVAVVVATKGEGFGDFLSSWNPIWPSGGKENPHHTRPIAKALSQIAERSPTPELREALPDLHDIAADPILQDKRSRAASRAAARKIDALTRKLDALPVTASAPRLNEATLPRESAAPGSDRNA